VTFSLFWSNLAFCERTKSIENEPSAKIEIRLYAFDFEKREAAATVRIDIRVKGVHNETIYVNVVSRDADFLKISPHKLGNETEYLGYANLYSYFIIEGSYYPFDSCRVYLRVELPFNITSDDVEIEYSLAGDVLYGYEKGDVNKWVAELPRGSSIHIRITLNRKLIWALPVLTPIAIGYLLLGASVKMKRKEDISSHLTIYLSVLVTSVTLFFGIKDALPIRHILSIAEILILSLMVSTSIFIIYTMLNRNLAEASAASIIFIELPFIYLVYNHRFTLRALNMYFAISIVMCVCLGISLLYDYLKNRLKNWNQ